MKAFILALLPGLEEETGEFFDKVSFDPFPRSFAGHFSRPDNAGEILGSRSLRPTLRDRFTCIFLPEYMACHTDNSICTSNRA